MNEAPLELLGQVHAGYERRTSDARSTIALVNDGGVTFDELVRRVRESAPDYVADLGDLAIVAKPHATTEGRPVVALAFTVAVPDAGREEGFRYLRVQTQVTLDSLATAVSALAAAHEERR